MSECLINRGSLLVSSAMLVTEYIEITSWLVSAYNVYARVTKNSYKRTSERNAVHDNKTMK